MQVQFGATSARVRLVRIENAIDTATLETISSDAAAQYSLYEMEFRSRSLLPLDTRGAIPTTSRFVLTQNFDVVGCGFVTSTVDVGQEYLHPYSHLITRAERSHRNGHSGAVIWMTGLSASGKSTLAMTAERRLFLAGANVYVLDGDNVRSGLNRDLGFAPEDRTENIRRVGEVAALLADAGIIVIAAFISPLRSDRQLARSIASEHFREIYVKADIATCRQRDPKGLYARAATGEIAQFTGISAPYEEPESPDLTIDTTVAGIQQCAEVLVRYVTDATR